MKKTTVVPPSALSSTNPPEIKASPLALLTAGKVVLLDEVDPLSAKQVDVLRTAGFWS